MYNSLLRRSQAEASKKSTELVLYYSIVLLTIKKYKFMLRAAISYIIVQNVKNSIVYCILSLCHSVACQ